MLQSYFKVSPSPNSVSLNDDAYLHRYASKALPVCVDAVRLNIMSAKQIGIFRKKMHEVRGKAATNDAL